jgi:phospholipid transport system substrate-binding protein
MDRFPEGFLMARYRKFFSPVLASLMIVALMAFGSLSGPAHADEFGEGAMKFIKGMTEDAISMLTVKDITKAERAERFRTLMLKNFAMKGIAKFVVGRHWRKASDEEKSEYLKLFEDLMVVTYAERFEKYSGEKLLVKRVEVRNKKDALVYTTMVKANDGAKPLKVDWRVRQKSGVYTIIDVMVEGISMIMTQKSEFSSFIKSNGGELNALLMELKRRIKDNS